MSLVERLTGTRAETCPWWAFHEPIVADVLACEPFFESGQLAFFAGDDPPAVLVAGVAAYQLASARVRDVQRREQEANRADSSRHAAAVNEMKGMYRRG